MKETDLAVGALTMTSEREEVIDFVAPYFEQSGILISNSLFYNYLHLLFELHINLIIGIIIQNVHFLIIFWFENLQKKVIFVLFS